MRPGDQAAARQDRLQALRLRCPACGGPRIALGADSADCADCGRRYPVRDGRPHFHDPAAGLPEDPLDRLKSPWKRFPRLYDFLIWLLSPLYLGRATRRLVRRHIEGRRGLFVNLGSGNTRLHESLVNFDLTPYDNVDVVCDVAALPIQDDSVDLVVNLSVLEHVPDPARVVAEILRVLRPGGTVYSRVPFLMGFHASPHDYGRWTHEGVVTLHRGFRTEEVLPNGGPTSALLWVFQEWVAVLLSFGSRRLHSWAYLAVMTLTFPLKFLDALLARHPLARTISSGFVYVGRKPGPGE